MEQLTKSRGYFQLESMLTSFLPDLGMDHHLDVRSWS